MKDSYLRYCIKSNITIITIIGLVGCIFGPICFAVLKDIGSIQLFAGYIVMMAILYPIFFLSYIHKKDEISFNLNLPLNKQSIWTTRFILSLALLWIQIFVNMIVLYIILSNHVNSSMNISYLLQGTIILFVGTFSIQSICAWIISKCNNVLDSIICIISYMFIPILLSFAIYLYLYSNTLFINDVFQLISKSWFSPVTLVYEMMVLGYNSNSFASSMILCLGIFFVIGCLCFVETRKKIAYHKVEDAGELTTKKYFYPLIAVLLSLSFMIMQVTHELISFFFIMILFFGILSLGKRKITITKQAIITYLILLMMVFGFNLIFHSTNGFGLEQSYLFNNGSRTKFVLQELNGLEEKSMMPKFARYTTEFTPEQVDILESFVNDYIKRYHVNKYEVLVRFDEAKGLLAINSISEDNTENRFGGGILELGEEDFTNLKKMLENSNYDFTEYVVE